MTIIAYHNGALHADDCMICPLPNEYVKTSGMKIHVSKCKRFAMAFTGFIPDANQINYLDGFFVMKLHDFYQSCNEQVPIKRDDHKHIPMLIDSMFLMTAEHCWQFGGTRSENSIFSPCDNGVPVVNGSGGDVLLSYWALGFDVEESMKKVNFFDSRCSKNIQTVRKTDLLPFKYLKVDKEDAKSPPANKRRKAVRAKGVPAS